uniref:Uncharacterized protein n=1 Tax=Schistosoma mansoni TaxID=6183 RepID=A0A5K4F4T5_SCHMA
MHTLISSISLNDYLDEDFLINLCGTTNIESEQCIDHHETSLSNHRKSYLQTE